MFEDLLNITREVNEFMHSTGPEQLARKVNKFFDSLSMATPNEQELSIAIEKLTLNAREALVDALKEQDTNKLIDILGLKDIIKIRN